MMRPMRILLAVFALVLMSTAVVRAQTYTELYSFCATLDGCPNGAFPISLIQATDGNFYGTTSFGGAPETDICANVSGDHGCGIVFKITPAGELTTLHWFCKAQACTDGLYPSPLVQAANGDFYGTTEMGGANAYGTIFKITPGGELTTLHNFCTLPNCADGFAPITGLIQATDGDLYGTAGGGTNSGGIIYKITPSGALTTLYNFCTLPNCTDGEYPFAALIQAADGNFYGTTTAGGANGHGTVFKITPSGALTTLSNFCALPNCVDGSFPYGVALIQATNGDFYGVTAAGGANDRDECTGSGGVGCGTVFSVTPSGALTTLYSFDGTDGYDPATLIRATNADFYGTTFNGTTRLSGTAFQITAAGTLTTPHTFCSQPKCADGAHSESLMQATNGNLYGTTTGGGTTTNGTVFSIDVGLGPFVALQTNSGEPGARVTILGNDLTGAASVTFNGTAAPFAVNSTGTAIAATVPTGATSGPVQVVTPNGTLDSNKPFRVR